jgi:hypothetical protein
LEGRSRVYEARARAADGRDKLPRSFGPCSSRSMGSWTLDAKSEPGVIRVELIGTIILAEMEALVQAYKKAVDDLGGRPYRVWCDISQMATLSPEVATAFEAGKSYSAKQPNFRGSAVLVASATNAMQHRRTSVGGGVMDTELISDDPAALREHLRRVNRRPT